ncbi:hypothetical protein SAMN05421767_13213 [Granulicatella balaenopterae]|uniref:Uncharacterized protein n=1 Tax=Granulicatella balaenopterae TaxID=137733 RepID=A0A1H9MZ51_9LACT|nr:hypothetical protein [Granulicatella balaenopterae]SER28952.1 hypothetical protein SAMN05421767_13213 [Granulicatella balaenopterae]
MKKSMYIHYDSVSNHILSSSIPFSVRTVPPILIPKNILLLKGKSPLAKYDDYTGFSYITGEENIRQFLDYVMKEELAVDWIDFESIDFLHQLSAQEVSELLYVSHANKHLHSPFFYKLQNNYIYLSMEDDFTKVYYRDVHYFYTLLAHALEEAMQRVVDNSKPRFFFRSRREKVERLPLTDLENLSLVVREGILVALDQANKIGTTYQLPILLSEDQFYNTNHLQQMDCQVGFVSYDTATKEWQIMVDEERKDELLRY